MYLCISNTCINFYILNSDLFSGISYACNVLQVS